MELFPNPESDPRGLIDMIRDLPTNLGTIVTLKIYQDLSLSEISEQVKISPRTVTRRWLSALKILRGKIQ